MVMAKKKPKPAWTGATIKSLRESLALTQKDAAARLRISQALWADWERGHRAPSPSHLLLLDLLRDGQLPDSPAD